MDNLRAKIQKAGYNLPDNIQTDKIVRFPTNGGKGNKNGWYRVFLNPNGSTACVIGDWQTGMNKTFFCTADNKEISKTEQKQFSVQIKQATEKQKQDRIEVHKKAALEAQNIWDRAKPASPEHPYLKKKQVKSYGLRQEGTVLILPVYDISGNIMSLQRIYPDGGKRFLSDGKTKGGFFKISGKTDIRYLCEGYATGATIHKATEQETIVAFNSGNLKNVAATLDKKYPDSRIVIVGDNDLKTKERIGKNPGKIAAVEAARLINASVCLCPVDSDFNDLMVKEGIEAVQQALKKAYKWEKPVSLKETKATELRPDLLPGILGKITRAVSTATETPLELAAGLILPVISTALHGKFTVQVKPGYTEPVNSWVIVALDPANRKSSVLMETTKPLSKWEALKRKEFEPIIREAKSVWQNQQARLKSLRGQYGKAKDGELKDIETKILKIENEIVKIPSQPQVWSQDVTTERLGSLMAEHDEKMSILSAEGGIFDIIGGRYSNGIANLDLYLQSHSSDPVKVDRGSREPVYLERPALSLGLSPQPEVLRGLVDKPGFRGKGLLARFLYLLPRTNLGYRKLESEPVSGGVENEYCELVYSLLDIEQAEDERGEKIPYILKLSNKAYREWLEFARVVEKDLREGGRFEYITDWAGKLPGAAARIAGLLHCTEKPYQPWAENISLETIQIALELASIFSSHALIAFDMMGADKALEQARKVWRWIERGRYRAFKKRDCFNALQGTFHKVANMDEALKVLQERNYIQEIQQKTGGRPSIKYNVNPELSKEW